MDELHDDAATAAAIGAALERYRRVSGDPDERDSQRRALVAAHSLAKGLSERLAAPQERRALRDVTILVRAANGVRDVDASVALAQVTLALTTLRETGPALSARSADAPASAAAGARFEAATASRRA